MSNREITILRDGLVICDRGFTRIIHRFIKGAGPRIRGVAHCRLHILVKRGYEVVGKDYQELLDDQTLEADDATNEENAPLIGNTKRVEYTELACSMDDARKEIHHDDIPPPIIKPKFSFKGARRQLTSRSSGRISVAQPFSAGR